LSQRRQFGFKSCYNVHKKIATTFSITSKYQWWEKITKKICGQDLDSLVKNNLAKDKERNLFYYLDNFKDKRTFIKIKFEIFSSNSLSAEILLLLLLF